MKNIKFPYQFHLIIGIIWVLIGIFLQSGWEMVLWIVAGAIFLIMGLIRTKKQKKKINGK